MFPFLFPDPLPALSTDADFNRAHPYAVGVSIDGAMAYAHFADKGFASLFATLMTCTTFDGAPCTCGEPDPDKYVASVDAPGVPYRKVTWFSMGVHDN